MIRRAIAVAVLTIAALLFASRFHPSKPGELVSLPDPPDTTTPPPSTASTSTTVLSSTSTTAFTRPTRPPLPTTTTIAPPMRTEAAQAYLGPRIRTRWGAIQVEIAVERGLVVDADIVVVPSATKRSEALTTEAEEELRYQVLTRQSPKVNGVSGATTVAEGYARSVAGAMRDAGLWPPPK